MFDGGVKETLCARCAHRDVCAHKQDYFDILKAVENATVTRDTGDGKITSKKVIHYSDPTAYEALKNIEREEDERFHRLLHTLFYLCELADFEIEGRIILVDKRNGRVWR